jgi:hypothetical protein
MQYQAPELVSAPPSQSTVALIFQLKRTRPSSGLAKSLARWAMRHISLHARRDFLLELYADYQRELKEKEATA